MMKLLAGVRVLDLTRLYPGPYCTMMMADLGAEVIKVEGPGAGDYMRQMGPLDGEGSIYFKMLNRNKKSIVLNLKAPAGKDVFLRLAEKADVVVEGFRPGVVDSLGIGYDAVRQVQPEIIYCSITGYGQDGPCRDRAGHDLNYIALSGILGITGSADGPPVIPGVQIGDVGGGSQMAISAILAALFARERGQGGRYLDVAMLDGLVSWLPLSMAEIFAGHGVSRGSAALNGGLACYAIYETSDDQHMALGALEKKFWLDFCAAVGQSDLAARHYQVDQKALKQELAAIFSTKTRKEWEEIFAQFDACCEPVLSLAEMTQHPQVVARGLIKTGQLQFPVKIKDEAEELFTAAPLLGQHTVATLMEVGYTEDEISELQRNTVYGREL